jgi:ribosomal protein L7/L12
VVNQDDVIAKLERLQQLRDAGVITQAELETQKAALLGQPALNTCAGCGAPLQVTADRRCIYCGTVAPATSAAVPVSDDPLADSLYAAYPGKKIFAIKELRTQTGLDLKEAKDRIDAAERRAQR